jgi:hypothetical protein
MTGLQEAFYIVGLIYMGVSLLVIVGILVGLSVIRKKIVDLENTVREKVDLVTNVGARAGEVISTVKKLTHRKGK